MTDSGRVEIEARDDIVVVNLIGAIDLANASSIEDEIRGAVSNVAKTVILDLAQATYLDSAGIRLVFGLAEKLKRRAQELRLVVPQGAPVERVLELANVGEVAALDRALESALSEAGSERPGD